MTEVSNPHRLKKGDSVVYVGPTRFSAEVMQHSTVYTLLTDIDVRGYACVTWRDEEGNVRNGKIQAGYKGGRGRYVKYREKNVHEHLYRHPTHLIELTNSGMPAEFILAVCQAEGCGWEAQW